jgi:sugar phosphate isomerase/epimerase
MTQRLGDIIAVSHLTLTGAPRGKPARSTFRQRVAAAALAGFDGIGWRLDDYERERSLGVTDGEVSAILAKHGLALMELEALYDWWCDDERSVESRRDEDALLAMAERFSAGFLTACDIREPDGTFDLDVAARHLAAVCDRAGEVGLHVNLEFLPWSSIPDAPTAAEIVRRAGRGNLGVLVDSWHVFRGAGLASLSDIPGDLVTGVQLNDAPSGRQGSWLDDTTRRRRLPGHGAFDLSGFLRLLDEAGARCHIAVEVLSDELHRLTTSEAAKAAHDAARAVVHAALHAPDASDHAGKWSHG